MNEPRQVPLANQRAMRRADAQRELRAMIRRIERRGVPRPTKAEQVKIERLRGVIHECSTD